VSSHSEGYPISARVLEDLASALVDHHDLALGLELRISCELLFSCVPFFPFFGRERPMNSRSWSLGLM
jgi:hypothetical protein